MLLLCSEGFLGVGARSIGDGRVGCSLNNAGLLGGPSAASTSAVDISVEL